MYIYIYHHIHIHIYVCVYSNSLKRTPVWLSFVERQLKTNPVFSVIKPDLYGFTEKSY